MTAPFIVFDLDDTLYLERDFAHSGFCAVGRHVRNRLGIDGFEAICQSLFDRGERRHVFDRALARMGVPPSAICVATLVEVYRGHAPEIGLAPDADRALHRLGPRLGLISDGPARTQRAKIRALGIGDRIAHILLTDELGTGAGKPSPLAFREMERLTGAPPEAHVYVADNPMKDFVAPRARGWRTVMIERPGRVHCAPARTMAHAADRWLTTLDALDSCLDQPGPVAQRSSAGTHSTALP